MVTGVNLQQCYIDLYTVLRKYLWDINTVEDILNLELSCFKAIPEVKEVFMYLDKLRRDCSQVVYNDDEMMSSFNKFYDMIQEDPSRCSCCLLDQVQEVD